MARCASQNQCKSNAASLRFRQARQAHLHILDAHPGTGHFERYIMSRDNPSLQPLIVLAGPTAVGKTRLALELAHQLDAEIINADSRSFYRGMDIGTTKPTREERASVPHHLVDILDPADEMSLSHFQQLAFDAIDQVAGHGHLPLLVGGTAQYLNAVVENWSIPQVAPDVEFRRTMEQRLLNEGVEALRNELRLIDPDSAQRSGPNPRRIIRALEIHRATGKPMSELQGKGPPRYSSLEFELWLPRDVLHRRIADRVDTMLNSGLVDEVRSLLTNGIDPALPAFSSIGYRDVASFIRGEQTIEATKDSIVHHSNRLVRHQQTWFRKNPRMIRVDLTGPLASSLALHHIAAHISLSGAAVANES